MKIDQEEQRKAAFTFIRLTPSCRKLSIIAHKNCYAMDVKIVIFKLFID